MEEELTQKKRDFEFPPNKPPKYFLSLTFHFCLFFNSSFFFVFIYLLICFLSLPFHFWFYFVFSLLLFLSYTIFLLCNFSFIFLYFLSVFGRPRSFGIPKTSSGPSNPEIHSLLTFMSLRSNRNEGLPSLCYKRRGRGTIEGVTILLLWGRPLGFSLLTSFRVLVLMRLGFLSY